MEDTISQQELNTLLNEPPSNTVCTDYNLTEIDLNDISVVLVHVVK